MSVFLVLISNINLWNDTYLFLNAGNIGYYFD